MFEAWDGGHCYLRVQRCLMDGLWDMLRGR